MPPNPLYLHLLLTMPYASRRATLAHILGCLVLLQLRQATAQSQCAEGTVGWVLDGGVCVCNVGYWWSSHPTNGDFCNRCGGNTQRSNKYQDRIGNFFCRQCPSNSLVSSTASTAITDCQCKAGYYGPNGGPCSKCGAGTYKATFRNVNLARSVCS